MTMKEDNARALVDLEEFWKPFAGCLGVTIGAWTYRSSALIIYPDGKSDNVSGRMAALVLDKVKP